MILHLILGFIYIEQNNIKITPDGKFHKPEHVDVDKKGMSMLLLMIEVSKMQVFPCQ
jgi:hypothetical protein